VARIVWSGIGPWHRTAYGLLTAEFPYRIRDLGHEVVIALMGRPEKHGEAKGSDEIEAAQALGVTFAHPDSRETRRTGRWDGMRVIGPGPREFGLPEPGVVREAFGGHDPDLIIVLKDPWVLYPDAYDDWDCPVLVWANIDCDPIGQPDLQFFRQSPTIPVAVSKFGLSTMRKHGLKHARYVPHGVDTSYWTPGSQDEARDLIGLPRGVFIAGINAANIGPRKAWGEQFAAFASEVHRGRRDSLLLCHAAPKHPEGANLRELAYFHGLNKSPDKPLDSDHVKFASNYNMRSDQMRTWYRSLDVLMACTYGEGFGVPIVEALSCGIPVIGTDCSAITEKIRPGCGWLVKGQKWWHPHFQAEWTIPNVGQIAAKLGQEAGPPKLIRESALDYDADLITREYWKPLIEEVAGG
jgi:glycosyltransferase involved in cell wall biosynthesis